MISSGPRVDLARVRSQEETFPGFFRLELEFPPDYPDPLPGQYLNLRPAGPTDPLFRRPFGVVGFSREPEQAVVELYYAVVGRGTAAMALWREGDRVDCLGPLGTPYAMDRARPAVLVAGGRGAAPLHYLYQQFKRTGHEPVRFAMGARSEGLLFGLDRLAEEALLIATDDGSVGFHGTVIDALENRGAEWLAGNPVLYACGPDVFLRAAALLAERHDLSCQVSLEGVYGCGLGLCRGCAVPLKNEERYLMQCQEGPVVDAARIDWGRLPRE